MYIENHFWAIFHCSHLTHLERKNVTIETVTKYGQGMQPFYTFLEKDVGSSLQNGSLPYPYPVPSSFTAQRDQTYRSPHRSPLITAPHIKYGTRLTPLWVAVAHKTDTALAALALHRPLPVSMDGADHDIVWIQSTPALAAVYYHEHLQKTHVLYCPDDNVVQDQPHIRELARNILYVVDSVYIYTITAGTSSVRNNKGFLRWNDICAIEQ